MTLIGIKKHNKSLRAILKECRCKFNKVDCRLEDKINILLRKYDIKPKVVFGGKSKDVNGRE